MMTKLDKLANIAVGMVEPLYEMNIGYVARAMKNFGLKKLYIISPRCDVGAVALKYSARAQDLLLGTFIIKDLLQVINRYDLIVGTTGKVSAKRGPLRRFITPEELGDKLATCHLGKVLILLGREDIGLKNEELKLCDVVVSIPANPEYPIMNVSHAAAIIFYEIYKKVSNYKGPKCDMPKREEIEVLLKYVRDTLRKKGKNKDKIKRAVLALKRILGSCKLSSSDVRLFIEIIKK